MQVKGQDGLTRWGKSVTVGTQVTDKMLKDREAVPAIPAVVVGFQDVSSNGWDSPSRKRMLWGMTKSCNGNIPATQLALV